MDDVLEINRAKTEFREGYKTSNAHRLLSVLHEDGFTNMSEGRASAYGPAGREALRRDAEKWFAEYTVRVNVIIINVVALGSTAYDYGWHEFLLTPKNGGETVRKRQRYFELWAKSAGGKWKITLLISNSDVREVLNGSVSRWFMSEEGKHPPGLPTAV